MRRVLVKIVAERLMLNKITDLEGCMEGGDSCKDGVTISVHN